MLALASKTSPKPSPIWGTRWRYSRPTSAARATSFGTPIPSGFGGWAAKNSLIHIGRSPIGLLQLGSVVVMGSAAATSPRDALPARSRVVFLGFSVRPLGTLGVALDPRAVLGVGTRLGYLGIGQTAGLSGGFCAGSDVTPVIVTRTGCCSERSSKPSWVPEWISSPPRACSWHPVE